MIVTDHHAPGDTLPTDALAVVNPHRSDSNYPFKDLSGSGVVLKLIQAVSNVDTSTPLHVDTYLDICSIGTIADVMPLV